MGAGGGHCRREMRVSCYFANGVSDFIFVSLQLSSEFGNVFNVGLEI